MIKTNIFILVILLISTSTLSYGQVFSATDSVIVSGSNPGNFVNNGRGFRFTPNSNLFLTELGKRVAAASGNYTWVIWNTAAQTIIHQQASASNTAAVYTYEPISTPVQLMSGVSYDLMLYADNTPGATYFFGASTQVNSNLTYGGMALFCNSCSPTTYPSGTVNNFHYGTPDFHFTITPPCTPLAASLIPDSLTLNDLTGVCILAAPTAPTATNNCGTITGTPNVTFPFTTVGTTVVTWTFTDGVNTITQFQNIIMDPIILTPDSLTLNDVTGTCIVATPTAPTAANTCGMVVLGTPDVNFPITTPGTTVVTWTFTDGTSTITQMQNVIITPIDNGVSQIGTVLSADMSGYSYQWLNCDSANAILPGDTNQTYTPTIAGNYAVQLTFDGCVDTSACTPYTFVGIDENASLNSVNIYPNPTNDLVHINLENHNGSINYTISTIEGRIVNQESNVTTNKVIIDLKKERKGIYFIKIEGNNQQKVIKLIKQ